MAQGGSDLENVGAGVDGAGGEGVPQGVRVQSGDAGAVAEPAEQAVRSSRVHRGAGSGGEQRPRGVAAVLEPVADRHDRRRGQDRGTRLAAFAGDPQHGGALLGIQVGDLEGEGFANPQSAEQQDGDQGPGARPPGGGFPQPPGLLVVQRAGVGVVAVQPRHLMRLRRRHGNALGGGVPVERQHRGELPAAGRHPLPGRREVGQPRGRHPGGDRDGVDAAAGEPAGELTQVTLVRAGGVRGHGAQPAGQPQPGETASRGGPDGQNIGAGVHDSQRARCHRHTARATRDSWGRAAGCIGSPSSSRRRVSVLRG